MPAVGIVVTPVRVSGIGFPKFFQKGFRIFQKKGRVGKKEGCFKKGDITN